MLKNYLLGFGFLGAATFIGLKSRNNVDETAAQTFGTLGGILLLVIIGLSCVRAAESERLKGGRKKKSYGPPKGAQSPPSWGSKAAAKPAQSSGGFGDSAAAEKLAYLVLGLLVIGLAVFSYSFFFVKSDFEKLALIDRPKSVEKGKLRMQPLLDKMSEKFQVERSEFDTQFLEFWEGHEDELRADKLKPSTLSREVLGAARKSSEFEPLAEKIVKQKPAARLARLHQKKPVFGKYPQEAEFGKHLKQLAKKTGLDDEEITATLIFNWKYLFEKKKKNRKFNLLWFVKHINNKTKKVDGAKWKKQVSKIRKGLY